MVHLPVPRWGAHLAAWAVHAYTASGAAMGLVAIAALIGHDYRAAFLWLAAQMFVDATDGALARAARVADVTPRFDGGRLDDIVDYLTYVVVPAVFVVQVPLVPAAFALPVACAMAVASALGFGRADAKTTDHFFTGFPSYWNIVVLYLFVVGWPPAASAVVLVGLSGLVFVPVKFVYPSRTPTLRPLTITLGAAWAVSMLGVIWTLADVPRWLLAASLVFPVYYVGLSLALEWKRRRG